MNKSNIQRSNITKYQQTNTIRKKQMENTDIGEVANRAIANRRIWAQLLKNGNGDFKLVLLVAAKPGIVPKFSDKYEDPRECKFIDGILCIDNKMTGGFTPIRKIDCILRPDEFRIWEYCGKVRDNPNDSEDICEEELIHRNQSESAKQCDPSDYSGENGVETRGYSISRNKPLLTGFF